MPYNSNQLMNRQRNGSTLSQNSQFKQDDRQLHFVAKQPTIQRVSSLRKVESHNPSFTPEIHQLPFEIYPERTKTDVSKQQLIERLIENRKEKVEVLRAEKIKLEDQQVQKCTFQPRINMQSKRLAEKDKDKSKVTFQRLYEEGLSKIRSVSEFINNSQHEKQNCTFQPNIGVKSKEKTNILPIYQRLEEIIAEKRQKGRRLQEERDESQLKLKPQLNYRSKQIVEKKADFKRNVLERLFDHLKTKNNRLEQKVEEKQQQIHLQCPFQPATNYHSQPCFDGTFLQRQQMQAEKIKQKMAHLQSQDQGAFRPRINKLSTLLVEADREGESQSDKIQRMYGQAVMERKAEIEKIEEEIYRQCTFQPEINIISKELNCQPHSHKCSCAPKEEEYHFKPEINAKSKAMASKATVKEKGLFIQKARYQLEYKEMKQCTFKPKTLGENYRHAIQKMSVKEIPGAGSYQQRIEKVKARRKQEEALKEKLFELDKGYVARDHTKVEPFNLTQNEPKLSKLKMTADQQFRKLHPFKPVFSSFR